MASSQSLALREQFRNPQQQRDTATMGMFTFMATEVMFFGGLFMAYSIYRMYYTAGFLEGSRGMTLVIGSINTGVLFTSCLTMSLAIHAISIGKQVRCYWMLILTAVIGLLFVALKFLEYFIHYGEHKVPGIWFTSHSPHAHAEQLFFFFYFALTGLHVIHLSIGIGAVTVMAVRTALGRFNAEYHTPIAIVGLYWHFVDIIWTFLYVIFYLPGFQ
ncbi:MAG: cytochrome c oxidase subunit 3 [Bryobacteraceae bacterium]